VGKRRSEEEGGRGGVGKRRSEEEGGRGGVGKRRSEEEGGRGGKGKRRRKKRGGEKTSEEEGRRGGVMKRKVKKRRSDEGGGGEEECVQIRVQSDFLALHTGGSGYYSIESHTFVNRWLADTYSTGLAVSMKLGQIHNG
jgi:hypothetical protein